MSTQMSAPATFTVGLVQMRSGLTPAANLETAVKLIGDAKAAGADYVQTPEMTNIMPPNRALAQKGVATIKVANRSARKTPIGSPGNLLINPRNPRKWLCHFVEV